MKYSLFHFQDPSDNPKEEEKKKLLCGKVKTAK